MARQDRVSQLIQMLNDAITNDDMDLASEIRSDLYREFQLKMSNGGKVKIPQLSTNVANISDVYEAIDDPSYVRDTTKIKNLQKGSKVTRKMGYNKIFETFEKKGISKATIQKFKNVPKITDFDNAKDFSNALKKFRETAFKGLNTKQINVIRSSGFLSNYAKDVRSALPKFGQGADRRMLNKALDDTFDYVFETLKTAEGVKKPKIQSKVYRKIREMGQKTLNAAQRLNLDYALSQVDKLFKSGQVAKATKMLAAISTMVAKGAFGKALPVVGNLITTEMGSGELTPEILEEYKKESEMNKAQNRMNMNQGGMMDMDYMMRPVGYAEGGYEDRMAMLEEAAMERDNYGKVQDDAVMRAALQIASDQGDTSEENVNLIIDQLYQLIPSVEQTMQDRTEPVIPTKMMEGIGNLINRLTGNYPQDRNVGFSRVE